MKILIGIAATILVLIIFISMRPSVFRVSRSTVISAPSEVVFEQVNDLHKWEAWSPWAKMDPTAKNSYEGPAAGTGAVMRWDGNQNVGAGSMTITESRPSEMVAFRLEFLKPFKGTSAAEFTFKPQGNQTAVTWTMTGENNFIAKAIGLFMNCDKMVGGQFDQGLAQLNSIAETIAKKS